ncbi:MAG TPA: hypothetical protein VFF03_15570 [Rhodocyclaceae bacterium]|nr:hypothetical protein [Rhodocyclaceae bacterium]
MENNKQNACDTGSLTPFPNNFTPPGASLMFSDEALAHCLADLKRQLELRQAMH